MVTGRHRTDAARLVSIEKWWRHNVEAPFELLNFHTELSLHIECYQYEHILEINRGLYHVEDTK